MGSTLAVKRALKDKDLLPEAIVKQAIMKSLIAQVQGIEPDGEMYDAKIKVMSEYVKHRVKVQHSEMFAKAKSTSLDLFAFAAQLDARKAELMTKHA